MIRLAPAATAAFAVALLGGCASSVVTEPAWTSIPSGEAMGEAYPEFATLIGMEGAATLRCTAVTEGRLANCRVREVAPTGLGFDRAALALASQFQLQPRQVDGEAAKSQVQFTIRFALAPEAVPAPWTGSEPDENSLTMARTLVRGFAWSPPVAPAALDVDADRQEEVAALISRVDDETLSGGAEAAALSMARLLSPEQLRLASTGQRRPPRPDMTLFQSANDRFMALANDRQARIRELYCARWSCEAKLRLRSPRPAVVPRTQAP